MSETSWPSRVTVAADIAVEVPATAGTAQPESVVALDDPSRRLDPAAFPGGLDLAGQGGFDDGHDAGWLARAELAQSVARHV